MKILLFIWSSYLNIIQQYYIIVNSMVDMDKYRHIRWDEKETMKQAQIALEMMKDFHGKTLIETHGEVDGGILEQKLGITQWDKHDEYKIWLQDIILRCETAQDPDDVFTEDEWQAVEAYAIEDTGIDVSIVLKGSRFRELYFSLSLKKGCVNIEGETMNVDNKCRLNCMKDASNQTGFFTDDEFKQLMEKKQ
jgi:hypothetical protein